MYETRTTNDASITRCTHSCSVPSRDANQKKSRLLSCLFDIVSICRFTKTLLNWKNSLSSSTIMWNNVTRTQTVTLLEQFFIQVSLICIYDPTSQFVCRANESEKEEQSQRGRKKQRRGREGLWFFILIALCIIFVPT